MDVVLSVPLFVGFALVAVLALVLLEQTRLFWVPGMALMVYGVAIYVAWPWFGTHEDVGGGHANARAARAATAIVMKE